jgi:sugar phosphate isomerase/epimerase
VKLSMMSYTMARQTPGQALDIPAMLRLTQELGLEAVDFCSTHDTDPREIRRMADDHGLEVCCYTFGADVNYPTAPGRAAGVDALKQGIETAVALGTDKTMLPTPGKEGHSREESRRNIVAALAEVAEFAAQAGVTMSVENFPGYLSPFLTSSDFLEAVELLPSLRLTFDNGNVVTGGEDLALSFERSAKYVIHAHFKDWDVVAEGEGLKGLDGRSYRGALIGEGIVDQVVCIEAMRRAGYAGYVNIEYEGNSYPADVAVRKAVEYLRSQGM